jgi:hypothetical protein
MPGCSDHNTRRISETEALRRFADMLCLWRLCANASCRRARSCRGRAHLCAQRNFRAAPDGVRDFFAGFLAAKSAGLSFEAFKSEMEQSEEFMALSVWRRAAEAPPR